MTDNVMMVQSGMMIPGKIVISRSIKTAPAVSTLASRFITTAVVKPAFGDLTVILLGDDVPKSPQSIEPPVEDKPEPTESALEDMPSGMQISPRTTKAPTVKILPASFKKKASHGKIWLVVISLSAILAAVLIWKLFFSAGG